MSPTHASLPSAQSTPRGTPTAYDLAGVLPARRLAATKVGAAALIGALRSPVRVEPDVDGPWGVLRTPRLTLRPLRQSDWPEFARVMHVSREHLARFCPLSKFAPGVEADLDLFKRQLDLAAAAIRTRRAWRMTAFDQQGRLVGAFNLNDLSRGLENTAELVVWISADQAGKGYATEGGRHVLAHALGDLPRGLGLHRIIGLVSPDNLASLRLLPHLGFSLAASNAMIPLHVGGVVRSHHLYERFASVQSLAEQIEGKPLPGSACARTEPAIARILATEAAARPAPPIPALVTGLPAVS
jgi:ribosomal-protein-alanine N-acetyltransferase